MKQIGVLIVDQNRTTLRDLKMLIEVERDLEVVDAIEDFSKLFDFLKSQKADVILMDLDSIGTVIFEKIRHLRSYYPEIKIILISIHEDDGFIFKGIEAGADAHILKGSSVGEIVAIIKDVYRRSFLNEELTKNKMTQGTS
jgi:two-component system response regulator DegU